jgi:hypothetical protein
MPRRRLAWISTSESACPSNRKKPTSSRTPTGMDQPRSERKVCSTSARLTQAEVSPPLPLAELVQPVVERNAVIPEASDEEERDEGARREARQ